MMSVIKDDPVSYGKDPNAMAAGILYGACLAQGEKVRQIQIAQAANLSVVTIRKRLQDVIKVFPKIPNGPGELLPVAKSSIT
jgi:transcription initiation factor TFIIIB Brf1 subunit/transcription initiation factor TFIIB